MNDKPNAIGFIVPPGYPMPTMGPVIGQSDSVTITRKLAISSIVTPWLDHPELIPAYEAAVKGASVIIVDTGSKLENQKLLVAMCERLGHNSGLVWTDDERPFSFASACNLGLEHAWSSVVMFLNNDIAADPGWLDQAERDVHANPNALLGPATDVRGLAGRALVYVEGWCIAAQRAVWDRLGGWDAKTFQRPYWEDVDLSWRAAQMGIRLRRRDWPVRHISNVTSDSVPGAKDGSDANRDLLDARIAAFDAAEGVARI